MTQSLSLPIIKTTHIKEGTLKLLNPFVFSLSIICAFCLSLSPIGYIPCVGLMIYIAYLDAKNEEVFLRLKAHTPSIIKAQLPFAVMLSILLYLDVGAHDVFKPIPLSSYGLVLMVLITISVQLRARDSTIHGAIRNFADFAKTATNIALHSDIKFICSCAGLWLSLVGFDLLLTVTAVMLSVEFDNFSFTWPIIISLKSLPIVVLAQYCSSIAAPSKLDVSATKH
ncbi:membrane hypothetical protein [Vibrio chagasii]|nr:membrane hypothetical protein [Vibrio chagasii]